MTDGDLDEIAPVTSPLVLDTQTKIFVDRALESGQPADVQQAVDALYAEMESDPVRQSKDPVVLAFVIEIARRIIAIENKIGREVSPPRAPGG